jgi:peptidoglycan/LPS O-acetylase OafA/YrhL
MNSNFGKRLSRIVQIVWLAIFAICIFEIFNILTGQENNPNKDKLWIFILISGVAFARFFMLRRKQFNDKKSTISSSKDTTNNSN